MSLNGAAALAKADYESITGNKFVEGLRAQWSPLQDGAVILFKG